MFTHILVPIDGSPTAGQAISKALAIAQAFNSAVTLIYVIDPYAFTGVGTDFANGQAEYLSAITAEAQQSINAATQVFVAQGIDDAHGSVIEGRSIYQSILGAAESVNADLVVMGSHGRRGLQRLVLGSVTAQVLAHAHLPVLVVRD